jgi:hypothetical protein
LKIEEISVVPERHDGKRFQKSLRFRRPENPSFQIGFPTEIQIPSRRLQTKYGRTPLEVEESFFLMKVDFELTEEDKPHHIMKQDLSFEEEFF